MPLPESTALQWIGVGTVLVLVGGLVKYRQWTFLLAGHNGQSAVPETVIAEMAGNTVLRIGIATAAFGVLASVTTPPGYLSAIVGLAIAAAVVRLLYRLNTYTPTEQ